MAAKGLASHRCSVTNRSARGHVRPRDGTIALPRVSKQPLWQTCWLKLSKARRLTVYQVWRRLVFWVKSKFAFPCFSNDNVCEKTFLDLFCSLQVLHIKFTALAMSMSHHQGHWCLSMLVTTIPSRVFNLPFVTTLYLSPDNCEKSNKASGSLD